MLNQIVHRPIWLLTTATTALLVVALVMLIGNSWRGVERMDDLKARLDAISAFEALEANARGLLTHSLMEPTPPAREGMLELVADVDRLTAADRFAVDETAAKLDGVAARLRDMDDVSSDRLSIVLTRLLGILFAETQASREALAEVNRDARREWQVATAVAILIPLLTLGLLWVLRRRVLLPLRDLGYMMDVLAHQGFISAPLAQVDPLVRPLLEKYNRMVDRLVELENRHLAREESLEKEVRMAIQALLKQERQVYYAERLAAVGEVAAGLAHELRNPLAGIHTALENLRRESASAEQRERLELVIDEVKRLTRLLNDLLNQARQAPEQPIRLPVAQTVDTLFELLRLQIPERITLVHHIPSDLECFLPADRTRQALLNLVLNAVQAIGRGPGRVEVRAQSVDGRLALSICDDGRGFPPELLQSDIRAFVTWREKGTGLGLATVRRFVREYGGDLQLSNRPDGGACVTLQLPCEVADSASPGETQSARA